MCPFHKVSLLLCSIIIWRIFALSSLQIGGVPAIYIQGFLMYTVLLVILFEI